MFDWERLLGYLFISYVVRPSKHHQTMAKVLRFWRVTYNCFTGTNGGLRWSNFGEFFWSFTCFVDFVKKAGKLMVTENWTFRCSFFLRCPDLDPMLNNLNGSHSDELGSFQELLSALGNFWRAISFGCYMSMYIYIYVYIHVLYDPHISFGWEKRRIWHPHEPWLPSEWCLYRMLRIRGKMAQN